MLEGIPSLGEHFRTWTVEGICRPGFSVGFFLTYFHWTSSKLCFLYRQFQLPINILKVVFEVKCYLLSHVQLFAIPWTVAHQTPLFSSLGNNTGVGCHFLLQGIFLTQGLNPGLLHCRRILYRLSNQGSPKRKRLKSNSEWWNMKSTHISTGKWGKWATSWGMRAAFRS